MSDVIEIYDGVLAPKQQVIERLADIETCISTCRHHQTIHRLDSDTDPASPRPACGGGPPGRSAGSERSYKQCAGDRRIVFATPTLCRECFTTLIDRYRQSASDTDQLITDGGETHPIDICLDEARQFGAIQPESGHPSIEVSVFALSTFVDGIAISPVGYDDTHHFDFEVTSRPDHAQAGTIECCPACESAQIILRLGRAHCQSDPEARYRCDDCSATFDQPRLRQADGHRNSPGRLSDAGQILHEADPETKLSDLGADNGGDRA